VPMRYGKTKVAIDFAGAMYFLERVRRVLVICPLDVIGVWEDELFKHGPLKVGTDSLAMVNSEPQRRARPGMASSQLRAAVLARVQHGPHMVPCAQPRSYRLRRGLDHRR
jgi:hypothetical protein